MTDHQLPLFGLTGWPTPDITNPYPVYRRYREAAPIHWGADGALYLFGYDEVATVLTSRNFGRRADAAGRLSAAPMVPEKYAALRTMLDNWLVFLDPPRHTELRSVCAGEFSPKVVSGLRKRIADIAESLLLRCIDAPELDLVQGFSAPLPILVISELLGAPAADWNWLRDRSVAIQEASSSRSAGGRDESYLIADTATAELVEYFLLLAGRQRIAPGTDLLSLLMSHQSLTADEIAYTCVHLVTAGHETTTNMLSKGLLALSAHPEVLAQLRASSILPPAVVQELVRFDGPVQSVTRWAYRDMCLAGQDISRGTKVVAVLGAANRDPARFPDPDLLLLDRPAGRCIGFGLGIHYCLGATLAQAEIEIGLGLLLNALGEFSVEAVEYPRDMVFHGPSLLRVRRE